MTQADIKETKKSIKERRAAKGTSNEQEVKAYIYQQLNELETLIPKGSVISVEINEVPGQRPKTPTIATRMSVQTPAGELLVDEMNEDVFTSITEATNSLAHQLTLLKTTSEAQINRNVLVDFYSQNTYIH